MIQRTIIFLFFPKNENLYGLNITIKEYVFNRTKAS
jgi:hypothetical protein